MQTVDEEGNSARFYHAIKIVEVKKVWTIDRMHALSFAISLLCRLIVTVYIIDDGGVDY